MVIKEACIGEKDFSTKEPRRNHEITCREVRVIDEAGQMLGVMSTKEAIMTALNKGMDLLEVSPTASPPVCKIIDYGKFKYQKKKKLQESKKKQSVIDIKEVQFSPRTEQHDIDFKVKHILRFLEDGDKAKITVTFRGREMAFLEHGYSLMAKIVSMVGDIGVVEQPSKMEGKRMSMIMAPAAKGAKPNA